MAVPLQRSYERAGLSLPKKGGPGTSSFDTITKGRRVRASARKHSNDPQQRNFG